MQNWCRNHGRWRVQNAHCTLRAHETAIQTLENSIKFIFVSCRAGRAKVITTRHEIDNGDSVAVDPRLLDTSIPVHGGYFSLGKFPNAPFSCPLPQQTRERDRMHKTNGFGWMGKNGGAASCHWCNSLVSHIQRDADNWESVCCRRVMSI